MRFRADEISSVIQREIEQFSPEVTRSEVGQVLEVGDGIARVYGLSGLMAGEMVAFENGVKGIALNLEESSVGVMILGEYTGIEEGDTVTATGELLRVPGRRGADRPRGQRPGRADRRAGPDRHRARTWALESPAPGIADRQPVDEPLQTGIKAIDAMIPIGRGQRELIIGDRKTGKTAIAIDAILNQKGTGVICVYVAIAQKESTTAGLVDVLRRHGAMDYTIVVAAGASDPAPMQYIAPYAGCAMAEYFMYEQGKPTLVIYDDLSKQAVAYREVSLLLRRPPGREAFPGDIFYAHSRLLERSCKLANHYVIVPENTPPDNVTEEMGVDGKVYVGVPGVEEAKHALKEHYPQGHKVMKTAKSGGSLTALPIIETLEGEVSAYIPTNVISITDGQIYLVPDLFFAGVRPAIDVGHQRLARRRQGADPGHEEGRRRPPARPGGVPRAGGLRPARHRARQGHPAPARPRLSHGRAAQAAAVPAARRHRPGHEPLRRHRGLSRRRRPPLGPEVGGRLPPLHARAEVGRPRGPRREKKMTAQIEADLRAAITEFKAQWKP